MKKDEKDKSELEKYSRLLVQTFSLDNDFCMLLLEDIERAKTDMEVDLLIRAIKNKFEKEARNYIINFLKQVYLELRKK